MSTSSGLVPIETLQVGDRVLTSDGQSDTRVDSSWQLVELEMPNPMALDDTIQIRILRPVGWLIDAGVKLKQAVPLAFPEIALAGEALVTKISPAPPITSGPGRVVLATVTHKNNALYRVQLNIDETIYPTAPHLLYSADRGDWVPTEQLHLGEHLQTARGTATVTAIDSLPGVHQVYNLEVESDHEFFVSRAQVLSHNAGGCGLTGRNWEFNPARDVDLRGGASYQEGLAEAFRRTGVDRDKFEVTKWGRDANGKSIPVEYGAANGAEVNMDIPEWNNRGADGSLGNGPHQPHIGYQSPGRGAARVRGHIFVDDVPATR